VDHTTFAKGFEFGMEFIYVGCIFFLSLGVTSLLFSRCYIFVFGCAHSIVIVSLCFGGFCCLFFGCVRNSIDVLLCFEDFNCLFLVVRVVMLLFHHVLEISTIVVCL
jgi:hypothetical protein